jgi:hypothetical protein
MRKTRVPLLKSILLTGAVILFSCVLTGTIDALHRYPPPPKSVLQTRIDASLAANKVAAQNYASHDPSLVINTCINFMAIVPGLPGVSVNVPDFTFNPVYQTLTVLGGNQPHFVISFNCTQSGPYADPNDPSTEDSKGRPDPGTGWYLQEIEGIPIQNDSTDILKAGCQRPVPLPPADAFLTRICNPRAIKSLGGNSMPAPCWNPTNQPNMTGSGGCAVCAKPPDITPGRKLASEQIVLCHPRMLPRPPL